MIEPVWFLWGACLPALLCAAAVWCLGRRRGIASQPLDAPADGATNPFPGIGWSFGVGLGFAAGFIATEGLPPMPPVEAQDWLAVVALPAAVVLGVLASCSHTARWPAWVVRLAILAGIAPLLLQPYITYTWTATQSVMWLTGLGAAAVAFGALLVPMSRPHEAVQPWLLPAVLLIAAGSTGIVITLSGSQSLGQLGLALAATIAGGGLITALKPSRTHMGGGVDVVAVLLIGLWLNACFYTQLSATHAALLAGCPLAAWVGWIPLVHHRPAWQRAAVVLLVVVCLAGTAVGTAAHQFQQDAANAGHGSGYDGYGATYP